MRPHKLTPEKLLLALVLLTIAALVFRGPLLETRLDISAPEDVYRVALDSDVQDGGNTVAEWIDRERLIWRCTLGEDWPYPFCGMQLYFSDSYLDGINLSNYTRLNLVIDYEGDAPSLRLFFRSSDPAFTRPDEIRSTKFNTVELDTRKGPEYRGVRLSYFRVADWWLQLYQLDMADSQADFANVGLIEIQTGTNQVAGSEHQFQLHKLELIGQRISNERFYLAIIIAWIVAILLYLAARIRMLSRAVAAGKVKQEELTEVNALLDQRSRTLEERAKKDPLTGAYNRSGIEASLTEAFHDWKYQGKPFALLLLDVDKFKEINDSLGHGVGDQVLRELSALVNRNIRAADRFARWGGEEFIIVCSNTTLTQARDLGEKLRKLVSDYVFTGQLRVTVSIGVAQIQQGENLERLFARADEAMYGAKNSGRNQVQVAQERTS